MNARRGWFVALVVAALVVGGWLALRPPAPAASASQPAPIPATTRVEKDQAASSPVPASTTEAPAPRVAEPLRPVPERLRARAPDLARSLDLQPPPAHDPVLELLQRFKPDELRVLAEVERKTGRPPSPEVMAWVESRRAGATADELKARLPEVTKGDVVLRALLLRWLEPGTVAPRPSDTPPVQRIEPHER